ncbi:MAG: hypothetical protein AABZ30_09560, partial [Myxococcota bacterium]
EHSIGLFLADAPATPCELGPGGCANLPPSGAIFFEDLPPGTYWFVVDAIEPGSEGSVDLVFTASANAEPELCADGLDNDGDGATDCEDPECDGIAGCDGPEVCLPDEWLYPPWSEDGSATDGTTVTLGASDDDDQVAPCAVGGGADRVLAFDLDEAANVLVYIDEAYGEHVLGLFRSDGRGACDATLVTCTNPALVPWSGGWIWPDVQPGRYFLIVDAFEAGSEGSIAIEVGFMPSFGLEDCENAIDDDADGLADCDDPNCASAPSCEGVVCAPEEALGLLAAGDTADAALDTDQGEDVDALACATPGGGREAVASLTLLEDADLVVEFAQSGNHAIALARNIGA